MGRLIVVLSMLALLSACGRKQETQEPRPIPKNWDSVTVRINQQDNRVEEEDIAFLIKRYGWNMQTTSDGLRYMIYSHANQPHCVGGQTVTLSYTMQLITGDTCYTSERDGKKIFVVDKGDEIVGLHKAVKLMGKGDQAKLVVPSYLGYGLPGDGNKVNGKKTLVFDIKIEDVN